MNVELCDSIGSCLCAVCIVAIVCTLYSVATHIHYRHKSIIDRRKRQTFNHPLRRAEDKTKFRGKPPQCPCPYCREKAERQKIADEALANHTVIFKAR